jgi:siderophore synthetase component
MFNTTTNTEWNNCNSEAANINQDVAKKTHQDTALLKARTHNEKETSPERILRQALEAALFEALIDYVCAPSDNTLWGTIYFSLNNIDYRCVGRVRDFDRVRLKITTLSRVHPTGQETTCEQVLSQLLIALPAEEEPRSRFALELKKTQYWCEWNKAKGIDVNGNASLTNTNRRALSHAELEMAMSEGHPYHPCFKARIGFNDEDHQRYSPESHTAITPHWVAVVNTHVIYSGLAKDTKAFYQVELGDKNFATLRARAQALGLDPNAVAFVPVHPWQWQQYIADLKQTSSKKIVDLGQVGDDYWASQSVRTLMNRHRPLKADLKLPLSIINTSAPRHLLSHGIGSGPTLSQWIADIVAGDKFFQKHPLIILREYAGIHVNESELFLEADPEVCRIGALWRESLTVHQRHDEAAAPLMALALIEQDGKPFIDPWVQRYGLSNWLTQLLDTLILPVWHLLAHHGIGLEAHGQNTLLLHKEGWPVRLAARDFHESVEYVNSFLAHPEFAPNFPNEPRYAHAKPNQYYWMESVDALRELAMDTLFVFHLSELALVCCEHYGLAEAKFWAMVNACLEAYRSAGYCDPERLDALNYQSPSIQVESLLRKKLCPNAQEYHHRVLNPLSHAPLAH